ncbi:MAG: 4'-phosphopantetheinyl transferase superfamily protein, partial [Umezawaea sp.]
MVNVVRPAEVAVWLVDVTDERAARHAFTLLPDVERRRLALLLQPHRRHATNAQAALRIITAAACGGALPLPELARDPNGKPVLTAWGLPMPPHVNLTHSGALAAVALTAAGPVGVDIERLDPVSRPDSGDASDSLAATVLGGLERQQWRDVPPTARRDVLTRSWTRKEAVLKALGTGLAGDLRSVVTGLAAQPDVADQPAGAGASAGRVTLSRPAWAVRSHPRATAHS